MKTYLVEEIPEEDRWRYTSITRKGIRYIAWLYLKRGRVFTAAKVFWKSFG